MSIARMIGGWGVTTPSSFMIAKHNACPSTTLVSRHAISDTRGSCSQGSWLKRPLTKSRKDCTVVARGPTTERTVFCPSILFAMPSYGNRPDDGRRPYNPLKAAGIRMLPPISVPKPIGLPLNPISAPSPPELPPLDRYLFLGFQVYPMMLLTVSPDMSVCGTLVLQ